MVYCGKPSRGCQNCKTRRIKCDEVRPICTQCKKSSRVCPGYPDEFDLIFRNETLAVKKRAQRAFSSSSAKNSKTKSASASTKRRKSSLKSISPTEPSLSWDTSPSNESPKSEWPDDDSPPGSSVLSLTPIKIKYDSLSPIEFLYHSGNSALIPVSLDPGRISPAEYFAWANRGSIPWNLPVPKESMVTSLFFKNHVSWPRHDDSERGFLEALPSMYQKSSASSLLHKAVNALALGTLSNARMSTPLRCEARREYGKALQELGVAIKSVSLATSDETLMSILLFAVYEQITWSYPSRTAWTRHVNGAVTLVKLRGQSQMANPLSKRLFRAVRTLMLTSSLQLGTVIENFPESGGWTLDEGSDMNSANRLSIICLELPNVKFQAQEVLSKEKTSETVTEMMSLIKKASAIDSRLENWARTLPDVWDVETRKVVTAEPEDLATAEVWPGPVHVYRDLMIANVLNDYRICRIFCQSVVLGCIAALPTDSQSDHLKRVSTQSVYVIQQMVNEFSWSIPYLMGFDYYSRPGARPQDEKSARATGAFYAVWPLFVTKTLPCIPKLQQEWLLGRLNHIGTNFGLQEDVVKKKTLEHL